MIGFATPWVLIGLLAATVPILLHLFARREPPTVDFPAVQYLTDTARHHQRRLNLQHLLLLAVRTALIVVLVLAAAGPTLAGRAGSAHAPAALVLVYDNSLSSGLTAAGTPTSDRLRAAAARVLERAGPDDALWLVTADGVVRRGAAGELIPLLDSLGALPHRLDLGEALSTARDLLAGDPRPGEAVIVTDRQRTALGPATGSGPVLVAAPAGAGVPNLGLAAVEPGAQPWTSGQVTVTVSVAGSDPAPRALAVTLGDRPARQGLVPPSGAVGVPVPVAGIGWQTLAVELGADELRLDDRAEVAVRIAPPAAVTWDPDDRFLAAALEVLAEAGRIRRGSGVTLGRPGVGASVILPPADPARVGALNRELQARGIPWRYGAPAAAGVTDSTGLLGRHPVARRQAMVPAGAAAREVLATVGGEPWLVRAGTALLLGSRLDTTWTGLPLSAAFVPFVDALVNRLAVGELVYDTGFPGSPVALPDRVDAVDHAGVRRGVEGGGSFRPDRTGPHYLLAGGDTVGVVNVRPDPRESVLEQASPGEVTALWPGARLTDLEAAAGLAFTAASRADLRPPLLWFALALVLAEAGLAAGRRRRT